MSDRGSILISTANDIGEALVEKLGGEGYAPAVWDKEYNKLGIAEVDSAPALLVLEDSSETGTARGSILLSTANAIGAMLNKKYNTDRGFKPKEWASAASKLAPLPEKSAESSPVCSIEDGADDVPSRSLVVTIPPTLTGESQIIEKRSGKNLLDTAVAETKENNSVSITCDGNGKYTATGTATGGSANITFTLKTPCTIKSGMYLHLMNSGASGSVAVTLQKQDNTTIYAPSLSPANRIADLSSYAGQSIYSIRFYISNGASFEMSLTPMICFSSSVTTYEPYIEPTTYTADLGRTIHGGTADIVNGLGSETHNTVDMGSLTWSYHPASGSLSAYFDTYLPSDAKVGNNQVPFDGVSENYISIPSSQIALSGHDDMVMALGNDTRRFFLCDQRYTNADDLKNALSGEILVYPITTPTEFTFDGQEIPTKDGYNAFWSDQGNTALDYYGEPEPYTRGTASGAIANVQSARTDLPFTIVKANIAPNLAGVESVEVTKAGKNLFDKENHNEVDGYITTTGFSTSNTSAKTIYIPIVGGATYTVSKTAGQRFSLATAEVIPSNNAVFTNRQANNTATSISINYKFLHSIG